MSNIDVMFVLMQKYPVAGDAVEPAASARDGEDYLKYIELLLRNHPRLRRYLPFGCRIIISIPTI